MGRQATSGVTALTGGRQKTTTGAGSETKVLQEKHGNRQECQNGDRETTEKRREVMANRRETNGCRWEKGDTGVNIKAPHHTLSEKKGPNLA
jgi:hypothetical protein